jgi:hypothetical protein
MLYTLLEDPLTYRFYNGNERLWGGCVRLLEPFTFQYFNDLLTFFSKDLKYQEARDYVLLLFLFLVLVQCLAHSSKVQ